MHGPRQHHRSLSSPLQQYPTDLSGSRTNAGSGEQLPQPATGQQTAKASASTYLSSSISLCSIYCLSISPSPYLLVYLHLPSAWYESELAGRAPVVPPPLEVAERRH